MDSKKNFYRKPVLILVGCALAIWLASWTDAANRTYQVHPEINLPAGAATSASTRTDTVMVLDAYERLMDNYMSLVQSNLNGMNNDMSQTITQLSAIDKKIDNIAIRIARIEKTLNIQPGPVPPATPQSLY